jgi:hypothetical protein
MRLDDGDTSTTGQAVRQMFLTKLGLSETSERLSTSV